MAKKFKFKSKVPTSPSPPPSRSSTPASGPSLPRDPYELAVGRLNAQRDLLVVPKGYEGKCARYQEAEYIRELDHLGRVIVVDGIQVPAVIKT